MPRPYRSPDRRQTHILLEGLDVILVHAIASAEERTLRTVVSRALKWYADDRGIRLPAEEQTFQTASDRGETERWTEHTKRHLGVYLDPIEYRLIRLQAAREDRTMSDLFKDALRLYLATEAGMEQP